MKTFVTFSLAFTSFCAFSQAQKDCGNVIYVQEETSVQVENSLQAEMAIIAIQPNPKDFQFIVQNNLKPLVTADILNFVKENRSQEMDLTIDYSDKIKLFIPSINTLKSPAYQGLPLYN